MRATLNESALAYENRDKIPKNTFRPNVSSVLKHHSRDAVQSTLPKDLALENTL